MRGAVAQATRQDPCHRTQRTSVTSSPPWSSPTTARRLLPGLIRAVREQTHPVSRVVGVDTGSQDRSGATLTELLGQDAVFGMDPETGYGAAVARALQHSAARRPAPGSAGGPVQGVQGAEWIWLLHDDCEPAADALEQLLTAASRSRSVAVVGPKLKDLSDRRVVREAGITTDRAGRRLTGVEPGEIDQGQHDGSRAVLAVSSAGMLIRRDVWDQLGGFDPQPAPVPRRHRLLLAGARGRLRGAGDHRRGGVPPRALGQAGPQDARDRRPSAPARPAQRAVRLRGQPAVLAHAAGGGRLPGRVRNARGILPHYQAAAQGGGAPRGGGLAVAAPAAAPARAPPPRRQPQARLRGAARPAAARPDAGSARRISRGPAVPRIWLRQRRAAPRGGGRAGRRSAAARHRFGHPARADQPGRAALRGPGRGRAGRGAVADRLGALGFGHARRAGRWCRPGAARAACGTSTWRATTTRASAQPRAPRPTSA